MRRLSLLLPLATFAAFTLAGAAFAAQDRAKAMSDLTAGLKEFNQGRFRAANVHLLNAVKADTSFGLAQAVFARLQLALGYGDAARLALDHARELGVAPQRINHLLGEAALMQGDTAAALKFLEPAGIDPRYAAYADRIRGRALSAIGDFAGAGRMFDSALGKSPKDSMLWVDIGRSRISNGNMAGAIEAATNATRFGPRNAEAAILMGETVRTQYGLVAAIPWFNRAIEIDNQSLAALNNLAATYGDAGENRAMLATARRMLIVDENNPLAYYYMAVLAARANRPDVARGLLYRVGERLDGLPAVRMLRGVLEFQSGADEQATRQLQPLLEMQPGNDKVRRLAASAYFRSGDFKNTLATILPIANRADADSYSLTLAGRALESLDNRAEAARYLDRVTAPARGDPSPFDLPPQNGNDPNNAATAIPIIARLIAEGRAGDALARARYLVARNPGVPAAYVLVGDSLIALNKPGEAAEAYRLAANIRFNEGTALRLVRALIKAGKGPDALRVLDLYITQNPRSIAARMLAADYFLANASWERAIPTLEGVRQQVGNRDALLLNNLAWAHLNLGNKEEALRFAQAAYNLLPTNPVVSNMFGWALFESGHDRTKGIALLEKALSIDPLNYGYRLQLARAYAETEQKRKARTELNWLLAKPDFADKDKARAVLKGL